MKNVDPNSIEIYHSLIKGEKEESQNDLILKAVEILQPCTAVQIEKAYPKFKINVITRSLYNLRKSKLIEKAFIGKCSITKNNAGHYQVIPKAIIDKFGQSHLF